MRLCLLGGFAAEASDPGRATHEPIRITSRKARALLAYLTMKPNQRETREKLADLLWGDREDKQARQSLRQCLADLRQELLPKGTDPLIVDNDEVGLRAGRVAADALDFAAAAASLTSDDLETCVRLYQGEFLAGFDLDIEAFDEWVRAERGRLEGLAARAFATGAAQWDAAGDARAVQAAERLVGLDPLREDWQRLLLRLHARHRGREAALTYAKTVTALLRKELGVEPESETATLIEEIRRGAIATLPLAFSTPPLSAPLAPQVDEAAGKQLPLGEDEGPRGDITSAAPEIGPEPPEQRSAWHRAWPARGSAIYVAAALALVLVLGVSGAWILTRDSAIFLSPPSSAGSGAPADASWQSPIIPGVAVDNEALGKRGIHAIVVLPFETYGSGGDRPDQALAQRLTNDLINDLSRVPAFRVISAQTSRLYANRPVDVAAVGRELGVRYLVEGGLQKHGSLLRINIALVDATNRLQVWSDRFEREEADRFAVQDEIVQSLANQLHTSFLTTGSRRAGSGNPQLEDFLAKGWAGVISGPSGSTGGAEAHFGEALKRDPDNLSALVGLGAHHNQTAGFLLTPDPEADLVRAEELLTRAVARAPNHAGANYQLGNLHRLRGRLDRALQAYRKTLEANPSFAWAYAGIGHILALTGEPDAMNHIRYAMRLNPKSPTMGLWSAYAGVAEEADGNETAAIDWFSRAVAADPRNPLFRLMLASALARGGDMTNARTHVVQFRKLSPWFSDEALLRWYASLFDGAPGRGRFLKGLELALAKPAVAATP